MIGKMEINSPEIKTSKKGIRLLLTHKNGLLLAHKKDLETNIKQQKSQNLPNCICILLSEMNKGFIQMSGLKDD